MNLHKYNNGGTLLQKIQLLESNANRVLNQHEVISKLLADRSIAIKFKQHIQEINQTLTAVDRLRENSLKIIVSRQGNRNNMKMLYTDGRAEYQIRDAYHGINKLKQQLIRLKQQQSFQSKQMNQTIQSQILQIKNGNLFEIQTIRKNVHTYLRNTKQDSMKNHQDRVVEYAHKYLRNQYQPYCSDIQADIGMTICELEYQNYVRSKEDVESSVKKIQMKFLAQNQKERKLLELGKLEREILFKQLHQFNYETHKRLIFDCQLLSKKVELAIQCIRASMRSKHKRPGMLARYQQQVRQFRKRINKVGYQIEGMKLKIKLSLHKIRILDNKIRALNPNQSSMSESLNQEYGQVETSYGKCKASFEQFNKLKGEFVYSQ